MLNLMYNLVRFSVIFAVCIDLIESEEAIVVNKSMSFWFKSSFKIDGTGEQWTNPLQAPKTEFSETSGSADNTCWMITKHIFPSRNGSGLVYIDIEIELSGFLEIYVYRNEKKPKIPRISPYRGNKTSIVNYLKENFNPVYNTTIPKGKARRITRTFTFHQNGSRGVTFGIKSLGANGKLWSMRMYYYYCKKTFLSGVYFPKTFSPATGSRVVHGSCPMHSLRADKESKLEAFCLSDGTWRTNNQALCFCLKGYEPSEDRGCSACAMNFVKPDNSNANCTRCPPNSISNTDRTLCECEKGHSRMRSTTTSSTLCYEKSFWMKLNLKKGWPLLLIGSACGIIIGMILMYVFLWCRRSNDNQSSIPDAPTERHSNEDGLAYQQLDLTKMNSSSHYQSLLIDGKFARKNETGDENEAGYEEMNDLRQNRVDNYKNFIQA